ncbi:DNA repair protein RecO [Rhodoligotrophos appendicifer]|uniref:DNA repair protein RecO n=1 Tax=Rhodoligotrophos appendicifer TaxID=987056 RepID=UPI001185B6C9|nr:DNA repair protein RecO [Rhodoligotrophos appendicifer]
MHWREEGIILSVRRHGESSGIVEVFSRGHGRTLGLVHGARSKSRRPVLQPGNVVDASWRARLSEQLGTFSLEAVSLKAGLLMENPARLDALLSSVSLIQMVPERESHPKLYDAFRFVLDVLDQDALWSTLLVRWELGLLEELGYGLDLTGCAGGGSAAHLIYVSPRSGKAVSAEMGANYHDQLLALPSFLRGETNQQIGKREVLDGFRLTGHFLLRHILAPRGLGLPEARLRLVSRLEDQL